MILKLINLKNIFFLFLLILTAYSCERPRCNDGIMNGDETEIDCGGICDPCYTCDDGIRNQGEIGIDCGGPCNPCEKIWNKKPRFGNSQNRISDIAFPSSNSGYGITGFRQVLKTNNKGESFTELPQLQKDFGLEKIFFLNPDLGFISCDNYSSSGVISRHTLLRTEDGGQNWEEQSTGSFNLNAYHFVNDNLGYMAFNMIWNSPDWSEIRKTTDGGKTWTTISNFETHTDNHPTYGIINNLFFHDENNGIAISGNKTFKTIDGGINWQVIGWHGLNIEHHTLTMLNQSEGFIIADLSIREVEQTRFLFFTKDGGITWEKYSVPILGNISPTQCYTADGYYFNNLSEGYYFSNRNPWDFTMTYHTSDEGQNWESADVFPNSANDWISIRKIEVTPSGECYILSSEGDLYTNKLF